MSRQSTKYIDGVAIALTQSSAEVILADFGCSGSSILEWNTTPAASAIWAIDQSMESGWSEVVSMGPKGISWCCHPRRQLVRCDQMQLDAVAWQNLTHPGLFLHFVVQFSNVRKAKNQVLWRCLFATLKLFVWGAEHQLPILLLPHVHLMQAWIDFLQKRLGRATKSMISWSDECESINDCYISICLLIGLWFWLKFNSWTAIFGFVCV